MPAMTNRTAGAAYAAVLPTHKPPRRLPGVEGVWFFVFADMVVFAIMFGCFMVDRHKAPALFEASRQALSQTHGGINTLLLLTSSMLVVLAIDALKHGRPRWASRCFALALLCGLAFMGSKAYEYAVKFDAGISMLTNPFFMYYFIMTGLHLVHVTAGNIVLAVLCRKSRDPSAADANLAVYEAGGTYWHMVDLLWVCIFPLFYLVR